MAQPVLFIGGLGRSGSTLIEKLLNEVPGMVGVGETVHLWERGVANRERCGCGAPFDECPRWSAIGAEAFGGWDNLDVDRVIDLRWRHDRTRRMPWIAAAYRTGELDVEASRYRSYLRRALVAAAAVATDEDPGRFCGRPPILVETSKHLSTAALLGLDDHLDLRVVHLIRDPRGVAYSWTRQVARPETDGELMPRYRPARTAGRWVTDNLGFDALASRVPTLRLRYEDVVAEPEAALATIVAFAGLDPSDRLGFLDGDTATLSTPLHSVAGNPLRFGGDTITIRADERWRTGLAPAQRRLVSAITAPALVRYGYPVTT